MTDSPWKVVMDRDGVTISSDLFQLTTNSSEPTQLDMVVSELQSVTRGTYGQYCGLSRAVEMVGERWGLLIIRDLLVSPRTMAELHQGLPRISAKLLSMRLKEMEYSGVIRQVEPAEDGAVRYDLTEYGRALEDILLALGRWGAVTLAIPRPEDIVTEDSMMVALRATFRPENTRDVRASYELHIADIVVNATIDNGRLTVDRGPLPGADAIVDPGPLLKALMTRELTAEQALATGEVSVTGDPELFATFVAAFELPNLPDPVTADA